MTTAPPDLFSDAATAKYGELVAKFSAGGPPGEHVLDLIRQYADAHGMRLRAIDELKRAPSLLVKGSNGNDFPHPATKVVATCDATMDRAMRRMLNLTPGKPGRRATPTAAERAAVLAHLAG